jgi:outer membrane protein insertion porin family
VGHRGDVRFLRTNLQFQQYIPLTKRLTLGLNAELGLGQGSERRKPYRCLQELLRRGPGHGAGFRSELSRDRSIPRSLHRRQPPINLNAELYFPVPGTGNDKTLAHLRLCRRRQCVAGRREDRHGPDLRVSAGIGLSWISPVGPLKLSWGLPLKQAARTR